MNPPLKRGDETAFETNGEDLRWWRVATSILEAPAPPGSPPGPRAHAPHRMPRTPATLPRVSPQERTSPPTAPDRGMGEASAAATLLAAGVACAFFGLVVILAEVSPRLAAALNHPPAMGPLSGKALTTIVVWLCTWAALHSRLRYRDVDLRSVLRRALVLTCLGFLATFPPAFQLFSRHP